MTGDEIRSAFLSFFAGKEHKIIPGSSLIPHGDPTLLLTSAGMVQFKPYFLGKALPPAPRLASCQKCFRTTDIESVGDATHLTFFEMLGNFSIGEYFKKEAIAWAWEFVTRFLKLPPQRLWITVFTDDDESFRIWQETGIPESRILRYGEKDNFWGPAGTSGPCGPCSEIHYDFGNEVGCGKDSCAPDCGCGRFSEIWNLVFTQYNQDESGHRTPLQKPNIDTGMGLERVAAVVQGKKSVYETDLFASLLQKVGALSGKEYGSDAGADNAIRIVAEHSRGIAFLIADGVIPGNDGRGYVLRRLLRRAQYFSETLVRDKPFLVEVVEEVIRSMGHVYPELIQRRDFISKVVESEVEKFQETLPVGRAILQQTMIKMREELVAYFPKFEMAFKEAISKRRIEGSGSLTSGIRDAILDFRRDCSAWWHTLITGRRDIINETLRPIDDGLKELEKAIAEYRGVEPHAFHALKVELGIIFENIKTSVQVGVKEISGLEAFILYDTYGFPVEMTMEIAAEHGFSVDLDAFEKEMEKQRERARAAHKFESGLEAGRGLGVQLEDSKSQFVGYGDLKCKTVIRHILADGKSVGTISEGQETELILDDTPFYGEMGGQVGDTGEIRGSAGRFLVTNTVRWRPVSGTGIGEALGDIILHQGRVAEGSLAVGDEVEAEVDRERRLDIARNHTATHLLQYALRRVLGEHVQQRGSLVTPDRFRFDFSHLTAMTREEIQKAQDIVNEEVRRNLQVYGEEMPYEAAMGEGAIALFDEKYGDTVRVLRIGAPPISTELCGGTHVSSTGEIGLFHVIGESGIGAGLRRIEAVTGRGAYKFVSRNFSSLEKIARSIGAGAEEVEDRVAALLNELTEERKAKTEMEKELARLRAISLSSQTVAVNGVTVLAARVPPSRVEVLREMSDLLRGQLKSAVIVLGTVYEGRPSFLAAVTPDLVARGYDAGKIVKRVAEVTGGGGGGKATLAQAGGKDKDKLDEALRLVKSLI